MSLLVEFILFLIVISMGRLNAAESDVLYCDPTYVVEIDESLTLQCSISGEYDSIFWFRGTDTSAVPFIWLEGDVGGGGYGEYNMTDDGALVINFAGLHHEGIYTIWVYFQDGTYETAETNVLVTIVPDPACPTFNALCNTTCPSSCSVKVAEDGEIMCSINWSRPKTAIGWNITDRSGISFTVHEAEFVHNADSDTWNTTLKLDYTLDGSVGGATIQCVAPERENWDTSGTTMKLYYAIGQDEPTAYPTPREVDTAFKIMIVIVVLIIVVITVIVLLCCMVRRRQRKSRKELDGNEDDEDSEEEMEPLTAQPHSSQTTDGQRREQFLINLLRKVYEKKCFVKPLPWDEPLPVSLFYTQCNCKIGQRQANIRDLLSPNFQSNHDRVLIIADLGYGKTAFAKHVVDRWCAGEHELNTILINVLLSEVNGGTRLSEYILHMLPPGTLFTAEEIEDILRRKFCHILLDGLDELSMSMSDPSKKNEKLKNPEDSSESKTDKFLLSVDHLLTGNIPHSYRKVHVWVTSREVDDTNSRFKLPYTGVIISAFSDQQLNEYITKVCKHYSESGQSKYADPALSPKIAEGVGEYVSAKELMKRVTETLEYNDISDFATSPLLLIMIIHIIASKTVDPKGRMKTVELTKLTTIVQMVITCLESRYIQKIQENVPDQLKSLEEKLGMLAMRQRLKDTVVSMDGISKEVIGIALAVGLLRRTKEVTGNGSNLAVSSFSGIRFYHPYFHEYLAAKYAGFNKETAGHLIAEATDDDQRLRLLKFMAGSDNPQLRCVLKKLLTDRVPSNIVIDCIHEIEGNTKQEETIKHLKKYIEEWAHWNIINLDKTYHREAITAFFALCKRTNVNIPSVTFREDAAVDLLQHFALPLIDKLCFLELSVAEDTFVKIIEYTSGQANIPRNIEFVSCEVPGQLSNDAKRRIQTACQGKKLYVTKKIQENSFEEAFDLPTFGWCIVLPQVTPYTGIQP